MNTSVTFQWDKTNETDIISYILPALSDIFLENLSSCASYFLLKEIEADGQVMEQEEEETEGTAGSSIVKNELELN